MEPNIVIIKHSNIPHFPLKLHEILDEAEARGFDHIISWMPDQKSFKIHQPESLLPILAHSGLRQNRYKSFLRQLQNYGFRREKNGPRKGRCHHELFVRGRKELCMHMRRNNSEAATTMKYSRSMPSLQKMKNNHLDSSIKPIASGHRRGLPTAVSEDFPKQITSIDIPQKKSKNQSLQNAKTKNSESAPMMRYSRSMPSLKKIGHRRGLPRAVSEDFPKQITNSDIRRRKSIDYAHEPFLLPKPAEIDAVEKATDQAVKDPLLFGALLDSLREKNRDQMNALFVIEASLEETFG